MYFTNQRARNQKAHILSGRASMVPRNEVSAEEPDTSQSFRRRGTVPGTYPLMIQNFCTNRAPRG